MAYIQYLFKSEYETGHQEIDDQHRQLVDLLNQILQSSNCKKPLVRLAKLCAEHFAEEEQIMRQHNCLDQAHCELHSDILDKLNDFCSKESTIIKDFIVKQIGPVLLSHDKQFHQLLLSTVDTKSFKRGS